MIGRSGREEQPDDAAEAALADTSAEADEARADGATASSSLAGVASTIANAAGPVISAAIKPVDQLATGARRMIRERSGARVRNVRRMGRRPLANLWDIHPEARRASIRELGLVTVPVEQIAGSAVEGAAQRGGDFLPLRDRRSDDWRARWQRILAAIEGMVDLPPVELTKFGENYWVVDGHNRVAAALYSGQVAIDAVVDELRLPGMPADRSARAIAPYLEGSSDLRAAGAGRLTRTVTRPDSSRNLRPAGAPATRRRTEDDSRSDSADGRREAPGGQEAGA